MKRRKFIKSLAAAGVTAQIVNIPNNPAHAANPKSEDTLCIFSKHLQFLPDYNSMAETAAEIGFDGVDLAVRPGGHVLPENVERDLPKAVKAIEKFGLKTSMMVTAITDAGDPYCELTLKIASQLGIRYYRMGYLSYDYNLGVAASLDKYKSNLAKLAALNEKLNIHGGYQNHAGMRIGGPVWDLWELLKDLDSRWIGCQYDIRHATVEGGFSWPIAMNLLVPYIKTTAIKDFYWSKNEDTWEVQNCMLGNGMVNFEEYFRLYKKANLSGPVSMHFEYDIYHQPDDLEVKRQKTIAAMSKDLQTLRTMIKQHGL